MTKRAVRATEAAEQQAVIEWWSSYCRTKGIDERLLMASAGGAHLAGNAKQRAIQMARLKRTGYRVGTPDLMLAVQKFVVNTRKSWTEITFAGLWIEMKRKGSKARAGQIEFAPMLRAQGYSCVIAQGFDEAQKAIRAYIET